MEHNLEEQILLRSVPTRWNSVAEMLGRALLLRKALTDLCDMNQFNKRGGVRLRRFTIDDEEWVLLTQLHSVLDVSYLLLFPPHC